MINSNQVWTTIGNLLIDLGKLAFGSLILGSLLTGGIEPFLIGLFGTVSAMVCFIVGIFLIAYKKE
jgi:hypothetical protein